MTEVQKLTQAAGLIRQATEVYGRSLEELEKRTGKEYHIILTHAETKADELLDYFARTIGECVLNEV